MKNVFRSKVVNRSALSLGIVAGGLGLFTTVHAATNSNNTITVYTAGPSGLADAIDADFTKATGIQVNVYQGTTGQIMSKLEAEKSNPQADVVVLADWSGAQTLEQEGELVKFTPKTASKLIWKDPNSQYFAYSASALGITYNTKEVATPPTDWTDAANSTWANKVVMPDPSQSGSAIDFVGGFLQNQKAGWNYFQQLASNGTVIQGANADALAQVESGAKDMVLAGVDYMAYSDEAKGEPINIVYPKSGTVVNPRPAMVLNTSKHIANAEAYVNFLLSKQGQSDVADAYLLPGVKGAPVNKARPSLSQMKVWKVNWTRLSGNETNITNRLNAIFQS